MPLVVQPRSTAHCWVTLNSLLRLEGSGLRFSPSTRWLYNQRQTSADRYSSHGTGFAGCTTGESLPLGVAQDKSVALPLTPRWYNLIP